MMPKMMKMSELNDDATRALQYHSRPTRNALENTQAQDSKQSTLHLERSDGILPLLVFVFTYFKLFHFRNVVKIVDSKSWIDNV